MSQNTSHAVMAQRKEAHDSLDDFPTQPWGTRALMEMLQIDRPGKLIVAEPAANRGYMARPLSEYFGTVVASDVHDYGFGYPVKDFLWPSDDKADWIITNPPFRLAEEFINTALLRANRGVAMLCRTSFSEGVGRYNGIFKNRRPTYIWQFVERLPMVKGRCDPKASTATSYAWYVWMGMRSRQQFTTFDWIPPCRKRLERDSDYVSK